MRIYLNVPYLIVHVYLALPKSLEIHVGPNSVIGTGVHDCVVTCNSD